jgi:hypothetical protein
MHKGIQVIILLMMIIPMYEALDVKNNLISLSVFPLSLGAILFIVSGLLSLCISQNAFMKSPFFIGLLLIYLGCVIGAFFSNNPFNGFTRAIGGLILTIAAVGFASLLKYKNFRRMLDGFFLTSLIYWSFYVLDKTLFSGKFISYSQLDTLGIAMNHHIPGMQISVSGIYVAVRFFYKQNKIRMLGLMVIGFTILLCLIIESRSNFSFTIITLLLILLKERKISFKFLFIILPLLIGIYLASEYFLSQYDFLQERFDLQDTANRQRATSARMSILSNAPYVLLENPLGKGLLNTHIDIESGLKLLAHNQYVTFVLAGGVVALSGVLIWLKELIRILYNLLFVKNDLFQHSAVMSYSLTILIFQVTLLTIENGGIFFCIIVSMGVYVSTILQRIRKQSFHILSGNISPRIE